MGHPMRLKLTLVGLLVKLASHNTTWGALTLLQVFCKVILSPLLVYNLPRLCALNVHWFNERKWLYTEKGKKKTIPRTNNYDCWLCWWHSIAGKYTCLSWIPAAESGEGSKWHSSPRQCRQNGLRVLQSRSNKTHLHPNR